MTSLLILRRMRVENANAVSGLVYGFPAITHFLGYVHALSRDLQTKLGEACQLGGCAVICHKHEIQAHRTAGWGDCQFSLTKNPLTKTGEAAPFNEEGRIHLEVSLVIECKFTVDDLPFDHATIEEDKEALEELVYGYALKRPLAGGRIISLNRTKGVKFEQIGREDEKNEKLGRLIRSLLPGFLLRDRSDLFKKHLTDHPHLNPLDALLDFYTLKSAASRPKEEAPSEKKIKWSSLAKPAGGWLVPIQIGYKAISPLYRPGEVANARDPHQPFRFVEPIYGIGEWMGVHCIRNLEALRETFWRYGHENETYLCKSM